MDLFSHDISAKERSVGHLLNSGRAWAISLTLRGNLSEEISKVCFPSAAEEVDDYLLYRLVHGLGRLLVELSEFLVLLSIFLN